MRGVQIPAAQVTRWWVLIRRVKDEEMSGGAHNTGEEVAVIDPGCRR